MFASPTRAQTPDAKPLTSAQLEQLVAPIALYPDDLLSQVLMASTYPLEVVEAARWVKENQKVTGQALQDAMQKQSWDPSVKALAAVPQTLAMMNDQIKWTQDLGDAFLGQQGDVLDAVQRLRGRAEAAGNLKSTPQQKVTRASRPAGSPASAPANAYTIVSSNPEEYFVPVYDPTVVYGAWPYDDYLPFYWYPPDWGGGYFGFGAGIFTGAAIWAGINWWNRHVHVNPHRFNQFNRTNITNTNWRHNAAHRGNVPYRNANVAKQFGDAGKAAARDTARQNLAAKGKGGMAGGTTGQGGMGNGGMGGGMGKAAWAKAEWVKEEWVKEEWVKEEWVREEWAAWPKAAWLPVAWAAGRHGGGMAGWRNGAHIFDCRSRGHGLPRRRGGAAMRGGGGAFASGGRGGGGAAMRGGGGFRGGGGGGGRGGGGRRSDIVLKHDIALIGHLDNGLGFYRFAYKGSDTAYVGVMAQEVQRIRPDAVVRGKDGYLKSSTTSWGSSSKPTINGSHRAAAKFSWLEGRIKLNDERGWWLDLRRLRLRGWRCGRFSLVNG